MKCILVGTRNVIRKENYQLILLTEQHLRTIFDWNVEENDFEYYTCRPLKLSKSYEEYASKTLMEVSEKKQKIYVLVKENDFSKPLGKITLFDLNVRNHCAEFGYYLPFDNRGKGFGSAMLYKFIQTSFNDGVLNLNKLYATTSSNNYLSVKLLEKYGFELEGRLREHYWINENKYDQLIYSILRKEWTK